MALGWFILNFTSIKGWKHEHLRYIVKIGPHCYDLWRFWPHPTHIFAHFASLYRIEIGICWIIPDYFWVTTIPTEGAKCCFMRLLLTASANPFRMRKKGTLKQQRRLSHKIVRYSMISPWNLDFLNVFSLMLCPPSLTVGKDLDQQPAMTPFFNKRDSPCVAFPLA